MISTIAVIVLSPFGHFSRLPYYASNVLMSDRTLFGYTKISFISQGEEKVDDSVIDWWFFRDESGASWKGFRGGFHFLNRDG
jgi:hypothetical protein